MLDAEAGIVGPRDGNREAHHHEGDDGESVGERAHQEVGTGELPPTSYTDAPRVGYLSG